MNALLMQTIRRRIALSNEEGEVLCRYFEPRTIKKKDLLFREGDIARDVAFVCNDFRAFHPLYYAVSFFVYACNSGS